MVWIETIIANGERCYLSAVIPDGRILEIHGSGVVKFKDEETPLLVIPEPQFFYPIGSKPMPKEEKHD